MKRTTIHALALTALAAFTLFLSILNLRPAHTPLAVNITNVGTAGGTEPPLRDIWDRILEKYDTNGNGKIDPDEYNRMWKDLQDQEQGQPGYVDTTLAELIAWLISLGYTPNEAKNIANDIMKKYDTNGDGILDSREWTKFWEDLRRSRPGDGTGAMFIPGTPIIIYIPGAFPGDPMIPGMPEA